MNIHGSLMTIFDQKKNSFMAIYDHYQARSANTFINIYLWLFHEHFLPKAKVIHDKKNLWLIDDHF